MAPADGLLEQPPDGYPQEWEADVLLADGATVHVRPILPGDAERLVAFHNRQSPESIYLRFFSPRPRLSARDVEHFTHLDYAARMAFVALLGEELLGVARYDRTAGTDSAEVAFITDDRHQGRGLATLLLEYLAAAAREQGIRSFTAQTLPQNRKMLGVFKQAGFDVSTRLEDGVIEVRLGIEPTSETFAAVAERERRAEARSITRLVSPRSVAVVGAGRQRGSLGHEIVRNLVAGGFEGPVYPVNAAAAHVASIRTHASILDVPDEVDLAIVAVPADEVEAVVTECAKKGVRGLVVISAGFSEVGASGAEAQRRIVEVARRHGMRLVGPNCMGIINTSPLVRLRATFAPVAPSHGPVGFLSQSGTLGSAIVETMGELGLGVSTFVSLGNRADVSTNDLLQYWEEDEQTEAVLLYLESYGNLRKFSRIARRVSRVKPIISVGSGAVELGGGSELELPPDATLDALLRHAGVIRVPTLELLFDVTRVLLTQPIPAGPRVAIVSNSSGPARLALDACRGAGLVPATLAAETCAALEQAIPLASHLQNPLDLTFQAGPEQYEEALRHVLGDEGVDSVMAIFAPPIEARTSEVAQSIVAGSRGATKPVLATVLGGARRRQSAFFGLPVPAFAFPEEAARALGRITTYGAWLATPEGEIPELEGVDVESARRLVERVLGEEPQGCLLGYREAVELVASFGLPVVESELVDTAEEAAAAAAAIGYPVVLKAIGLSRLAKTESGGLAVDLHSEEEVLQSYQRMRRSLGEAMCPALVQQMLPSGVDVAIRVVQQESVGSVISLGLGGAVLDQIGFDALRFLPLTDLDAERLIGESRLGGMLPPGRRQRVLLRELLLRSAALAEAVPEMAELRLNPVILSEDAAAVTGLEARIEPWKAQEVPVRRLEEE